MGERFRTAYGASPLHLLATIASFAIAGYGFLRIVQSPSPAGTLAFLALAAVAHDLIAFPLYSGLNLIAGRALGAAGGGVEDRGGGDRDPRRPGLGGGGRVPAINHLRIPFALAAFALLLFFPLILGLDAGRYENASGESVDVYLGRWLLLSAALFGGSAVVYALRLRRARPNRRDGVGEG